MFRPKYLTSEQDRACLVYSLPLVWWTMRGQSLCAMSIDLSCCTSERSIITSCWRLLFIVSMSFAFFSRLSTHCFFLARQRLAAALFRSKNLWRLISGSSSSGLRPRFLKIHYRKEKKKNYSQISSIFVEWYLTQILRVEFFSVYSSYHRLVKNDGAPGKNFQPHCTIIYIVHMKRTLVEGF